MRHDREARGLRQADVADALHVERSNVSQFETGGRVPSLDYVRRWQASYGPDPELDSTYRAAVQERDAKVSTRKARRDAASLPPPSLPGSGSSTGEPGAVDTVVQALSDSARASIHLAWKLWHADGDATALDSLGALVERLEQAVPASRGELRSHVLRLLGYAHRAMGCRAFDRLNYTAAIGHFHQMRENALAMLHLGDIARRRQRYASAVHLLDASEPHARTATAATQARRWQLLARTHAERGDRSLFLRTIDHAEACTTQGTSAGDLTATELRHERAQGLTLLGDPRAALTIYQATEPTMQFQGVRDRANFIILKAQALAHAGDLDEGIRFAIDGLTLARSYDSPRHVSRVQRMYDRLRRTGHGTNPRPVDLRDALAA